MSLPFPADRLQGLPDTGFWGAPTSSIDWCEANYRYTRYVCELYNTVSSLAMVVVGLAGVLLHARALERRFSVAFAAIGVVGIGSAAYHATLRFELQLLDELPMVYLALVMVFILLTLEPGPGSHRRLALGLALYGVFLTALSVMTRGQVQFYVFQLSFGSLEVFSLYRVFRLYRGSRDLTVRRLFHWGMASYLVAVTLWFVDLRFCDFVSVTLPGLGLPNPELHAVWHLLVSIGFYLLVLLIAHRRLDALGQTPGLGWYRGLVPRVVPGPS